LTAVNILINYVGTLRFRTISDVSADGDGDNVSVMFAEAAMR
jgi:hypothetical protein